MVSFRVSEVSFTKDTASPPLFPESREWKAAGNSVAKKGVSPGMTAFAAIPCDAALSPTRDAVGVCSELPFVLP
jgi:hypothetical protein